MLNSFSIRFKGSFLLRNRRATAACLSASRADGSTLSAHVGAVQAAEERPWRWNSNSRICASRRSFTSESVQGENPNLSLKERDNAKTKENEVLLFERGPGQLLLMRTGFGFSSFQTAYWIWYTTEYIPMVNASSMDFLHIDPAWGVGGILFSLTLQGMFVMYPTRLISKITLARPPSLLSMDDQDDTFDQNFEDQQMYAPPVIRIYTHHIPWIRPADKPKISISTSATEKATLLDPTSSSAKEILFDCKGKIDQGYQGMLVLRSKEHSRLPFLLDFTNESTIPESQQLIQALLFPDKLARSWNKRRSTGQQNQQRYRGGQARDRTGQKNARLRSRRS